MDPHETVLDKLREVLLHSAANDRKLPTERELCQQLGISRTALREHLQALEVVGLLRRDQGRGTFLESPDGSALGTLLDIAMVADDVSGDDLMFVRRVLERESAVLACGRISEADRDRMILLCAQMAADLPAKDIAQADHEFHMILLKSSGNAALTLLSSALSQAVHRSMLTTRQFIASDRRVQLEMARAHRRVLDAVWSEDRDAAWKEMDRHFELTEKFARRVARTSTHENRTSTTSALPSVNADLSHSVSSDAL